MKKYLIPSIVLCLMVGLIASGAADRILEGIGAIEYKQIVTPANPPASSNRLYIKSDDDLYLLNSAGTEDNVSITDLTSEVANELPIANGGCNGTTATTCLDNISPVTTKGDLIIRDATNNIRVAVLFVIINFCVSYVSDNVLSDLSKYTP